MILRFWKTEWNIPVLPKIYSGNIWAQREQPQPGQQEKQSWQCWRSWELTQKEDCLSCCPSQRPRLAFGAAAHQKAKSLGTPAKGQPWTWGSWHQESFSRHWLRARGELIPDCYCRGVVSLAAALSICLPGLDGGEQGAESIQATLCSCPWACRGSLPSEQTNLTVGQSYLVLCPFAGKVTSYWWSVSHKDIATPQITGQSSFFFWCLFCSTQTMIWSFFVFFFLNLDQRQWAASRLACRWPCNPAWSLYIAGVIIKELATKKQLITY